METTPRKFRQTFLPTKNYLMSQNQLKSSKLKTIFEKIINKPNSSYATNPRVGEKRELMLPCLFSKYSSQERYFTAVSTYPLGVCDFPNYQRHDPYHSFHVGRVFHQLTCPTCQDGIRRRVHENAHKQKGPSSHNCQ